jgi:glucosamine-6-phosphate deaminase
LVVEDADGIARIGADLVAGAIAANPAASVVAATGNSPMGLYAEIAARRRSGRVDTTRLTAFQLDEYLGIEAGDRRTLLGWMRRSFIDPLAIGDDRVVRLPTVGDLETACAAFDRELTERGGLDLAILGLGPNGHLGFNEPPSDAGAPTRVVELSPATIEANARYWGDPAEVPALAVTMGMAPLLAARAIVLVVTGPAKHAIVRRALEGPVGPTVPASFLQAAEGDVTVVVDRSAWGDV